MRTGTLSAKEILALDILHQNGKTSGESLRLLIMHADTSWWTKLFGFSSPAFYLMMEGLYTNGLVRREVEYYTVEGVKLWRFIYFVGKEGVT